MNRRAFIGWLTATAAGVAAAPYLDVEKLLWKQGERKIFIPEPKELWTSTALQIGDIFTIDGVYVIHPITGDRLSHLQSFVLTADVSAGSVPLNYVHPRLDLVAPQLRKASVNTMSFSQILPSRTGQTIGSWKI